jgi:hypothetical protein
MKLIVKNRKGDEIFTKDQLDLKLSVQELKKILQKECKDISKPQYI